MKKIVLFIGSLMVFAIFGCGTPVGIQKTYTEHTYYPDGKVKTTYQESITQTPEKLDAIHLKNKELYQ